MKILILEHALTTGGAERQVIQDANMLIQTGHEVMVCFGQSGELKNQLMSSVNLLNLETTSQIKASIRLHRFLKKNKFDLIMAHMFWANKVAVLSGKTTEHKIIIFEHGLGLWRKWYHLIQVKIVAKYASKIVTCSEVNRNLKVSRENIQKEKLIVIPNSFNPVNLNIEFSEFNFPLKLNTFKIGFAGRFNAVKQLHLLIEIALLLKMEIDDFQFILLGDGEKRQEIEVAIRNNFLEDHFILTGHVANPQKYLRKLDCFILPSKIEDFSLALLEASSLGLPCLAFDVGGNKEIVIDGKTGWLVEPFNIKEMFYKIIQLHQSPELTKSLGANAKKRVEESFSTSVRLENLKKLIKIDNQENTPE